MTLYLGAGGGGDTNSAIFRALSDTDAENKKEKKYVLGAGYSKDDYLKTIQKNAQGKLTDEEINEYLDAIMTKEAFKEGEIYKLNCVDKEEINKIKEKYIAYMKTREGENNFKTYANMTYKTLYDESEFLIRMKEELTQKGLLDEIYMAYSVELFDVNHPKNYELEKHIHTQDQLDVNTSKFYKGILEFITKKEIKKIHLMDFGADIFDFKKLARDTSMLLAITHMMQNNSINIELIIEVYGPGVDAHDDYNTVIKNIEEVKPAKTDIDEDTIKQLYDYFTKNQSEENPLEILNQGRATGNYLEAVRICHNLGVSGGRRKQKKNCKGGALNENFVNNWLGKRPEISQHIIDATSNPEKRQKMQKNRDNILEVARKTQICDFSKAYKFEINSENIRTFVDCLNNIHVTDDVTTHYVARDNLELLEKIINQSSTGGKKKIPDLKKTDEKIKVGKRYAVVYVGKRGGKYIKMKGTYVNVRTLKL